MALWHAPDAPYLVLAIAGLGILIAAAAMGLFSGKNHMPVEGKTVLITGASEGLGRSAARQLAAKGANVILVARNVPRLEEALKLIKSAAKSPTTQRFTYISADVSVRDMGAKLLADTTAWNGGAPPDVVWCAAGMSTPLLFLEEPESLAALRRNMDVNFFGAAEVARAALAAWVAPERSGGAGAEPKHLVFTASVLALYGVLGYAPYTPTKWALRGLADTLAQEVRLYPSSPVKVHVVYPGTILSPGFERETLTKPDITLLLEKDDPQQTPDEVARAAIKGLERGYYGVTVGWLGTVMLWGFMGGAEKNNWVLDTVAGWFIPLLYAVVRIVQNSQIAGFVKTRGHPSSWPKKAS